MTFSGLRQCFMSQAGAIHARKPMLEEKLLQASKASHKDRKRMFLMLFAMALCSVIFIGIVSVVDFNAPPPSSKASSSKKAVTVAITPPEKDPSALRGATADDGESSDKSSLH